MPRQSLHPSTRRFVAMLGALLLTLLPYPAAASFGGRLDLGFGFSLVAGMVIAVPVGLLCLALEWAGARHRPPAWLGLAATAGVLYCFARGWSGGMQGEAGFLILPVPPLMSLALVVLVRPRRQRVIAVWAGAALASGMVLWRLIATAESARNTEFLGGMLGGVTVTMLLWYLGYFLGRKQADGRPPTGTLAMAAPPAESAATAPSRPGQSPPPE